MKSVVSHKKRKKSVSRGSMLVYALVIMTVVSIILTAIIGFVVSHLKFSSNRVAREEAFQIAEAGIYSYRWYLAHATDGMNAQQLQAFWQDAGTLGVSGPVEVDYTDPGTGDVIGRYRLELVVPDPSSTIATVTSTGTVVGDASVSRAVKARFRRPSWSEYIFLVHDFINFGTAAEVYGRVHSNTGIRFDGLAHNSVTSALPSFNDPSHSGGDEFGVHTHRAPVDPLAPAYPWPDGTVPSRPDVFGGGRQFPVPDVSFIGVSSDLVNMQQESSSGGGRYFDCSGYGRRIILKTNGTFDVCTVNAYSSTNLTISQYLRTSGSGTCGSCSGLCLANYPIPDDGIIFVEDNAWVEGTINDLRVTIAAANIAQGACGSSSADIYLGLHSTANLRYTNYDGRDIIGLVAQRSIQLGRDCPEDFTIDAAILAQGQTGRVFRDTYSCPTYHRDSLTINGAIASYLQPYFNSGSCGFTNRSYNFDNNLLYYPPPYFPTGTEYSIDLWEEL